jgi:hypothetical protein
MPSSIGFDNGTHLLQLQNKAQTRALWEAAIIIIAQKERNCGSDAANISMRDGIKHKPDTTEEEEAMRKIIPYQIITNKPF